MIRLDDPNNFGCTLRDLIYKNMNQFKSNENSNGYSSLRRKLSEVEIPKKYWGDILKMSDYRKYDRTKDWVEELLQGVVIRHIVSDLINDAKKTIVKT
jgi:hypothetical protein